VGLRPGDHLFASGPLGAGAAFAGATLLGIEGTSVRDFHPPCRLAQGQALRGIASACIDTSDGLIAAVDQLARLNQVGINLDQDLANLLAPPANEMRHKLGIGAFPFLAGIHGEFELVFAVPPDRLTALPFPAVPLGRVTEGEGLRIGRTPINGAHVRNLFTECSGNLHHYIESLIRLDSML
jgi:thiamine-monophosphate kinase